MKPRIVHGRGLVVAGDPAVRDARVEPRPDAEFVEIAPTITTSRCARSLASSRETIDWLQLTRWPRLALAPSEPDSNFTHDATHLPRERVRADAAQPSRPRGTTQHLHGRFTPWSCRSVHSAAASPPQQTEQWQPLRYDMTWSAETHAAPQGHAGPHPASRQAAGRSSALRVQAPAGTRANAADSGSQRCQCSRSSGLDPSTFRDARVRRHPG